MGTKTGSLWPWLTWKVIASHLRCSWKILSEMDWPRRFQSKGEFGSDYKSGVESSRSKWALYWYLREGILHSYFITIKGELWENGISEINFPFFPHRHWWKLISKPDLDLLTSLKLQWSVPVDCSVTLCSSCPIWQVLWWEGCFFSVLITQNCPSLLLQFLQGFR